MTVGSFPARASADRNAFLLFTALVWVAVLSGFGTDTFNHLSKYGLDYPLIVHFHAVAFVGYLVLFTVQVTLKDGRYTGAATVKQTDFGIKPPGKAGVKAKDEVRIEFDVQLAS